MRHLARKLLPGSLTDTGVVINMGIILFISACVPPNASETRKVAKETEEATIIETAATNKTTGPSAGDDPASGDYFSQSDKDTANEEVTELALKFEKKQNEKASRTETVKDGPAGDFEPRKYNEAATVVGKTEAPVDVRRGTEAVKEQNLFYDKSNDAYSILQKANESLAGFPVNRVGEVDWMEALNRKLINPRASLSGDEERPIKNNDIIMKNTKEMPYVRFSHRAHSLWLDCSNCHDKIFLPGINASQINMHKIFGGEYCGVCHNKVAFTTYVCEMCHSVNNTPE